MFIDYSQLEFIHPTLRELVEDLNGEWGPLTVTSLFRMNNESSPHGVLPLRATDFRCWNEQRGRDISNWVNNRWIYDPTRVHMVCCMFHGSGQGLHNHVHVQVHPNTRRKQ